MNAAGLGPHRDAGVSTRDLVLVTHATPEDNEFAVWLATKLMLAGYRTWVDVLALRGGQDFWSVIEERLRREAAKQVVVVSKHVRKPGVLKELAIGDAVARKLGDAAFMIPVRVDNIGFSEVPPEIMRANILDASRGWHHALAPLLATLQDGMVPKAQRIDPEVMRQLVDLRETGRQALVKRPEVLLTNWFEISAPPKKVWFYGFDFPGERWRRG